MKLALPKGHRKGHRAFTLIELLVVIAIIGILSSVVLASLNTARAKGADAAVKSNLANTRAQAELFYDSQSPQSYGANGAGTGVCANVTGAIGAGVAAAGTAGGGAATCNVGNATTAGSEWAASAPLKVQNQFGAGSGADWYCVDSKGTAKVIDATLGVATVCP